MGDLNVYVSIFPHRLDKAVGTLLGWGWGKKFCAANIFVCVTLTYKKDTILYMSIFVISKIN